MSSPEHRLKVWSDPWCKNYHALIPSHLQEREFYITFVRLEHCICSLDVMQVLA